MNIDAQGVCTAARQMPSPNQDARSMPVELLVIHHISLPPDEYGGDGVLALFNNTLDPTAHPYYASIYQLTVSVHFFIRRDGELIQCVSTEQRAWHAGVSSWRGRSQCNDFSIGIELEGGLRDPYAEAQYMTLAVLLPALRQRYPTLCAMTGHEHIALGRKTDPGPLFDWSRVQAESGLAFSIG